MNQSADAVGGWVEGSGCVGHRSTPHYDEEEVLYILKIS